MTQEPLVGQGLFILEAFPSRSDKPHSVGFLWTSDQPDTETSTWQQTTLTVERIIYDCGKLNNERRKLIADISKEDHWPVGKNVLVNKYLKQITHFINSI